MTVHPIRPGADVPLDDRLTRESRDWVTTVELCSESGLSYRQVDYWTRSGLLTPAGAANPGTGARRAYGLDQLDRAKAMRALLDAGIDIKAIAQHIDHLIRHGGYQAGPVTVTYTPEMNQ